jgi:polyribonucleotide nucleotidyltransferase
MPAPLVGIAIATAAKMAAKKLATKAVKKKALSNTFGAKGTIKKQVTLKKKAAVKVGPKNSVKVVNPQTNAVRASKNYAATMKVTGAKSGSTASLHSVLSSTANSVNKSMGMKTPTVKIKSGGDIKPAVAKKAKPMSYSQLKDMPNLVKIDSAKGNTVKKVAYRKRTSN